MRVVYDTEVDELLDVHTNGRPDDDPKYRSWDLRSSETGGFYFHERGGVMTDVTTTTPEGVTVPGQRIRQVTDRSLMKQLKQQGKWVLLERLFPEE